MQNKAQQKYSKRSIQQYYVPVPEDFLASLSSLGFSSFFESFEEVSVDEALFSLVPSFGWPVSLFHTDPKNPSCLEDSDEDAELDELRLLEGTQLSDVLKLTWSVLRS